MTSAIRPITHSRVSLWFVRRYMDALATFPAESEYRFPSLASEIAVLRNRAAAREAVAADRRVTIDWRQIEIRAKAHIRQSLEACPNMREKLSAIRAKEKARMDANYEAHVIQSNDRTELMVAAIAGKTLVEIEAQEADDAAARRAGA